MEKTTTTKLDGTAVSEVTKTIFGVAERDFMALMLTLSLLLNIYLVYHVLDTTATLNDEIKEEIRRQAVPAIRTETSRQLEPIKSKIDTTVNHINNLIIQDNNE